MGNLGNIGSGFDVVTVKKSFGHICSTVPVVNEATKIF
jgi:hypothetical protein